MSPAAIPGGQNPMIYPFWAVVLLGKNQLHWLVVNCLVAAAVFSGVLFVKDRPHPVMDTVHTSPLLPNTESRITIFSAAWLSFGIVGTVACFYVQDVSAPYWLMGILAFPVVLGLFYAIDRHLNRTGFANRNATTYMVLMCLAGMLLYWPGLLLILWLTSRFLA
jgi:hypothetical protein